MSASPGRPGPAAGLAEPLLSLRGVLDARRVISRYLPRTPQHRSAALSRLVGCEVFVKYEHVQPIGAFKVRGGINLIARLTEAERRAGVIAASTGNHGQSVAYAAQVFAVKAVIGVPEESNPDKVQAMRDMGAEVLFHGKDYDEAREHVEALARERGYRYIHSANEPLLVAGVGTIGLEILEDLPDVEVIIVPVGGGSGAAGIGLAAKAINPHVEVIGVQSEAAPAAFRSWQAGHVVEMPSAGTFAEGLATRLGFQMTLALMGRYLDDFVLVSEEALEEAIVLYLERAHQVAEGAGAAALAAALQLRERLRGKKVVLDLSGGNLTREQLQGILARRRP
ncbi:MAG: threonine/serine dehydratase [Deltaproteobacteria bacterium]|nr:threonine/serine dehydratase [Deltaproteobacteria bacterium]